MNNCLLHFPPAVWNYKDVSVRSKQGLGRACGVSRLLLHPHPPAGVQERDVRVSSFKQALGCGVNILLQHTPLQWESKSVATPGPSKLIKLVGSASWSLLLVSKWGRKRHKYPTSWLDRSVDGILVKKWRTADSNDSQNVKC